MGYYQQHRHEKQEEDLQQTHDPLSFRGTHRSRGKQLETHSYELCEVDRRDDHEDTDHHSRFNSVNLLLLVTEVLGDGCGQCCGEHQEVGLK